MQKENNKSLLPLHPKEVDTIGLDCLASGKVISLFVKDIWVFENLDKDIQTRLPFFADGYPGLIFQQTESGLTVQPHDKTMPEIFLYGQTIKPIELETSGAYLLIIFQFYPFVLRTFFNIAPQSINDDCYHLDDAIGEDTVSTLITKLHASETNEQKVRMIAELLLSLFEKKKEDLDYNIREAIGNIVDTKGQERILAIAEKSNLGLRTFERRFVKETGLSPKRFSTIVRFQEAVEQVAVSDYSKLTDIAYENGFADQSHFIRVFKAFTGKTPKAFTK